MPCEPGDNIFEPCHKVKCQCTPDCVGILRSYCRNRMDTLTFLTCDVCGCGYVANDFDDEKPTDPIAEQTIAHLQALSKEKL